MLTGAVDGLRPVSYTHLDVYKRQAPALVQQLLCNPLGQLLFLAGKELVVLSLIHI